MTYLKSRRGLARPVQSPGEEIANAVSHGFGALLAVAGMVLLTLRSKGYFDGEGNPVWVYLIFTATMILMFLSSTLYHAFRRKTIKGLFKIFDHAGIYLFIAGTCTPIALLGVRGVLGWVCFGVEWVSAITGVILYALNCKILKKIEIAVYLLMGWAIMLCVFRLIRTVPFVSFVLLIAGGFVYTLGILWYIKPARRGAHTVWHLFVLGGAVSHWWSVWFLG